MFKFDWFRSKERKQLEEEKLINARLLNRQEELKVELLLKKAYISEPVRPYKKLIYTNGSITVILPGGVVINQKDVSGETFDSVKIASSESEIRQLLQPKIEDKVDLNDYTDEEIQFVVEGKEILRGISNFEFEGDNIYLKGVKLVIPPVVLASFIEITEKEMQILSYEDLAQGDVDELNKLKNQYNSLKMFWLKLATSPRKESRDQVLTFCKKNDIRLSKTGNIIAYRRVVKWDDKKVNKKLYRFIQEEWKKVKSWKHSPKRYTVHSKDKEFFLLKNVLLAQTSPDYVGNLDDLYLNAEIGQEELYTSWHNKGKYTFKIGDVYKANEDDIDTNSGNCHSGGLHFAACDYDYSGYGDTPIVVLINPAKTITIPEDEIMKGRTVEMKIVCINPSGIGVHIDESLIEKADEEYNEFTIDQLEHTLSSKDFNELCIQEEVPEINLVDLASITSALRNRIIEI